MEIQTVNFNCMGMFRSAFKTNFFSVPQHIHQCSEIVYVLEGELEATVANEKMMLKAGDVAIIPPFIEHVFHSKKYVKLWLAVFSSEILENFMATDEIYRTRSSARFKISKQLADFIADKLPDTDEEMLQFNYYDVRKITVVIYPIYNEYLDQTRIGTETQRKSLITDILLYLSEHYSEPLTINDVARSLGYTPRHISRHISTLKNYNFRELLNTFRIEHAKSMIRNSTAKLANISVECGFSSERSFFRCFSKIEGITPMEYRKIVKKYGRNYKSILTATTNE